VCTATWFNKTNVHSFGARQQKDGVTSAGDCLDYCSRTTTCVAVEVDYNYRPVRCWVYDDPSKLSYTAWLNNVVQYHVLSRRCHTPGAGPTQWRIQKFKLVVGGRRYSTVGSGHPSMLTVSFKFFRLNLMLKGYRHSYRILVLNNTNYGASSP